MTKAFRNLRMGNTESLNEIDCQYDSTWEEEDDGHYHVQRKSSKQLVRPVHRNLQAARDMQIYRHMFQKSRGWSQEHSQKRGRESPEPHTSTGCFGSYTFQNTTPSHRYKERQQTAYVKTQHPKSSYDQEYPSLILQFYQNLIAYRPDGVYIEDFHNHWFRDHMKLERVHSYIQWVFPLQEQGMNQFAPVLSARDIMVFRKDKQLTARLLRSYEIMLHFYGIELVSEKTGEVRRGINWEARFDNLNRNSHNNLRITRILKCLGLLGFERYQAPLAKFFLEETLVKRTLPRVKQSALDYFMFSVVDKNERKKLVKFAFQHFVPREEFVWCPERIKMKLLGMNPHKVSRPDPLTEQQRRWSQRDQYHKSPQNSRTLRSTSNKW